ncbi:MAG: TonB-dependent receptor [Pseudomonadota bacterium]
MGNRKNKYFNRAALTAAVSGLAILAIVPAAVAQMSDRESQVHTFRVTAGPLVDGILTFSEAYGTPVLAPDELMRGKRANAVSGALSASDALGQLLKGTGLEARSAGNGNYVLAVSTADVQGLDGRGAQSNDRATPADTIIVTGTKQDLSLQDTQTSVSVVTAADVEEQALFNMQDILLRTPNVAGGETNDLNAFSIRGVSVLGVGNTGGGATSNIYVDNAPKSFNANRGTLNLWDVAQVEVLRGPQSTVQGRNALAGAIVINMADPEYDFGAKARALVGNNDSRQYSGMVTGPIIADQLALRIAADYREADFGVRYDNNGESVFFEETLTLRGKLLAEPDAIPGLRVELIAEYLETDFGDILGVFAPVPVTDPAFSDFDPFGNVSFSRFNWAESTDITKYVADISYNVNDVWTLIAIGSYADAERFQDLSIGPSDNFSETYTAELRAAFDTETVRGWIGAYYFDDSTGRTISVNVPTSNFPVVTIPADTTLFQNTINSDDVKNYAIFADVTFDLNDRWTVNLGARYDWEELIQGGFRGSVTSNPANCVIDPSLPVEDGGGAPCSSLIAVTDNPGDEVDYEAFLPRGSIIYNFDELRSVSFNVARGYRRGGVYLRSVPGEITELRTFDPEFLTNYEIAFRSEWPDFGLVANANVFYSDWTDQQVTVPGALGINADSLILNAGSSEIYGAEFSLEATVSDTLNVYGLLGLLQTQYNDFPFAVDANGDPVNPSDPQFANLAGNEFDNAPNITAALGVVYNHPSGFFASGDASYAGSRFSDVENLAQDEVDAYTLVNGRIGYRTDLWEVSLFADNLFDERFANLQNLFRVSTSTGVVAPNGLQLFDVNEPRLWGVELRMSY